MGAISKVFSLSRKNKKRMRKNKSKTRNKRVKKGGWGGNIPFIPLNHTSGMKGTQRYYSSGMKGIQTYHSSGMSEAPTNANLE